MFTRYAIAILADLVVLNVYAQYSANVSIDNFTTALLAALLLQLLLQATLSLEHWVGAKFDGREGWLWSTARVLSAWIILFGSKFAMLGAIDRVFGDAVLFSGSLHGVVALIAVLFTMLGVEELFMRVYRRLA